MKKTFLVTLIVTLILIFSCIFVFSSCSGEENDVDSAESVDSSICQHAFGEWKTKIEPTCKKEGKIERTCTKCAETEAKSVDKLTEHTPIVLNAVAATCERTGLTEGSKCSACKKILVSQEITPKLSHNYVNRYCALCDGWQLSEGLEFAENDTGYKLVSLGACRDNIISIPSTYNGKAVTEIAQDAIKRNKVDRIIIPDSVIDVQPYAIQVNKFFILEVGKNVKFHQYAIDMSGGCEIINKTGKTIDKAAFCSFYDAPLVINNTDKMMIKYTSDGFGFLCSDGKYYLCDYIGRSNVLVLPDSYEGNTYTIATACFANLDTISKVVIGSGVDAIGAGAFEFSSLSEIDLRGRVSKLPYFAFCSCKNLKSIVVPDNITYIDAQCFDSSGIVTISIGKSVQQIEHSVFARCDKLETVYFNAVNCEKAKTLSGNMYYIKNVIIGKDVERIPAEFMKRCSTLTTLTFEEGSKCKFIGGSAFAETSLTSIVIPESVETMYGFNECELLERVYFNARNCTNASEAFKKSGGTDGFDFIVGKDATRLPEKLLYNATVKSFSFEENSSCAYIEHIGKQWKNVTLPDTVRSFSRAVFDLETLIIGENNPYIDVENNCVIRNEDNALITVLSKEYTIPDRVKIILADAFFYADVTKIYIPDTVERMEDSALASSTVVSIRIPFIGNTVDNIKKIYDLFGNENRTGYKQISIDYYGYYYAPATLTELTVGGGTIVLENTINGLGLSTLKISKNVTKINEYAVRGASQIYYSGTEEEWNASLCSDAQVKPNVAFNAEFD